MGTGYSISVELFFILLVFFFPFLGSYSGRYGRHRAYYLWAQNWHYRPKFFDLKGNIQRSIDRLRVLGSKDSSWCIDQIRQGAFSYFHMVQKAWSNNDLVGLERLVHPKLFPEWRQEIESFKSRGLKNKVDVIKVHALDVVDFVDDPNDESDRIFLRIHAQIVDAIVSADGRTQSSEEENFVEYWILARAKGYWRLLEIQSAEVFESEHPVLLKA